jgi:eukaryotic-like serine/threonine-protein kinase
MTLRQQFERAVHITLLVFILAAAGFLSAVTAMRIAIRGRVVNMPNLVGKEIGDAQGILANSHLQLQVADRVYSSLPANAVVRQSPAPGEQMKVSQDASVVLSLGPQSITVPLLEGHSVRAARITLLEAGLQLGEVSTVALSSSDPDTVLQQDPQPGKRATSPRVDLLVAESVPPVSFVMPELVGAEQQEADRMLTAAGLRVPKHTYISQAGALRGTVIGQTPPAGTRVDGEASVQLSISQ